MCTSTNRADSASRLSSAVNAATAEEEDYDLDSETDEPSANGHREGYVFTEQDELMMLQQQVYICISICMYTCELLSLLTEALVMCSILIVRNEMHGREKITCCLFHCMCNMCTTHV